MKYTLWALAGSIGVGLAGSGHTASTTLDFDELFAQLNAERDALLASPDTGFGDDILEGTYTEAGFALDYRAEGVDTFWSDGWQPSLMGFHDGGDDSGTGSQFDTATIRRADGGAFALEEIEVSNWVVSVSVVAEVFDMASSDYSLHPVWNGPDDIPDTPDWQEIGEQAVIDAGLPANQWFDFLYRTTDLEFFDEYTAWSDLRLTGETAEGTVVSLFDPTRAYVGFPVGKPEPGEGVFDTGDFGAGLEELTALRLELVRRQDYRPALFNLSPAFAGSAPIPENPAGGAGYSRNGDLVGEVYGFQVSRSG